MLPQVETLPHVGHGGLEQENVSVMYAKITFKWPVGTLTGAVSEGAGQAKRRMGKSPKGGGRRRT